MKAQASKTLVDMMNETVMTGSSARYVPKPHCPSCTEGLLRIIRSDDTVRHVNGDLCKRFHDS